MMKKRSSRDLPPDLLIALPHEAPSGHVKDNLLTLGENPDNYQVVVGRHDVVFCSSCMQYFNYYNKVDIQEHCDESHETQKKKKPIEDDDGTFTRLAKYLKWRAGQLADTEEFFMKHQHEFQPLVTKKAENLIKDQDFFEKFEKENPTVVKRCVETMAKTMLLEYLEKQIALEERK